MTDITALAERLYTRIEWQRVPFDVTQEDLINYIVEAIRYLYVLTGRALQYSDDLFLKQDDLICSFSPTLAEDEKEYVLLTALIEFYRKVQTTVSDLTSYTTDAMSVTHGDKPYQN